MNNLKSFIVLLLLVVSSPLLSQSSGAYDPEISQFQRAVSLFDSGQYQAAITLFESVSESSSSDFIKAESAYYTASSAVRTKQKNAEQLMDDFIYTYPEHPRRNSAYFDVAQFYFRNRQSAYALKWFEKVEEQKLTSNQRDELYFERGYCYFVGKKYEQAQKDFSRVVNSPIYKENAKYYLGFMAYEGDDYFNASLYFDQLQDPKEQSSSLNYYQADKSFKEGEFQKAIDFALRGLEQSVSEDVSQLSKIIGESYFNLKKYDEALPYLKNYKGIRGKWEHVDFYQLGYIYFKQNKFELAISEFNRILEGNDAVSQNAYHHLAQCYLALDKKSEALTAFKNASELNFDQDIKSDASLQYAKLSYDIGNPFQPVPIILSNYLTQYPDSSAREEMELLLVNAYVTSRNYQAAYEIIASGKKAVDEATLQTVTFNLAISAFQDGNFQKAQQFFERTSESNAASLLGLRSTYWLGELAYDSKNYQTAIRLFRNVRSNKTFENAVESKQLDYALGYAYFSTADFISAASYFDSAYNSLSDMARKKDALLRLADSEFAQSHFREALDAYVEATNLTKWNNDYAVFQQAICLGLLDQLTKKNQLLNDFSTDFPSSPWRDDVLLILGNDLAKAEKNDQAILCYSRLVVEIPNSPLISKANLRKGLLFYNMGKNSDALSTLKPVALNRSAPEESRQALTTIEQIYIDMGEISAYAAWLKKSNLMDFDNSQFDDLSFESAQKRYIERDVTKAIRLLEKYLIDFPNGSHQFQSHVYLSELFLESNDLPKAIPHLTFIIDQPTNAYSESALIQLSDAYLIMGKSSDAIAPLKRLASNHPSPKNQSYAHSNLMQIYYDTQGYTDALSEARLLMEVQDLGTDLLSKTWAIKGRCELELNLFDQSKRSFSELQDIAVSKNYLAEAKYYQAFFLNQENQFQSSNDQLQNLVKEYPEYPEFSARGLLLMARNFIALNDDYQANYILNHLIDNFNAYPDISTEANKLLENLQSNAAETNASIINDHE